MADRPKHRISKPKKSGESWRKSKGGPTYKVNFETGDAGIFITCDMGREGKCAGEAIDLLTEYCGKSLAKESSSEVPGSNVNDDDDDDDDDYGDADDIEAQIRKEIEGLKPTSSSPRLFQKITSNIPCMVFLRVNKSIDPVQLVHDICAEAKANPDERKSRWIKRMTPITQIRKTLSVDVHEFAKEVLHPYFHVDDVSKKYAIRPSVRNNSSFDRDAIIKTVADAVGPNHKVDLKNYDYTILVEIAQNTIGISVVGSDYDELKRFNLSEIYSPTPKPQQNATTKFKPDRPLDAASLRARLFWLNMDSKLFRGNARTISYMRDD